MAPIYCAFCVLLMRECNRTNIRDVAAPMRYSIIMFALLFIAAYVLLWSIARVRVVA